MNSKNNAKPNTSAPKEVKGKAVIGESLQYGTKENQCFKCYDYGRFNYHFPMRNRFVDEIHDEPLNEHGIEIYKSQRVSVMMRRIKKR